MPFDTGNDAACETLMLFVVFMLAVIPNDKPKLVVETEMHA